MFTRPGTVGEVVDDDDVGVCEDAMFHRNGAGAPKVCEVRLCLQGSRPGLALPVTLHIY